MDKCRKQFQSWWEEWFGEAPLTPWNELWCGDGYSAEDIDHMWEAWQASRAAVEIDVPDASGYWNGSQGREVLNHRQLIADICDSIRAAGLKVKGE
ncbi:hypothetical protein [Cronobacter malonaticus]|uniref:hypothetical protein n=1 Tax=Cronobacter malonaticus TaxID=413503 RepID=UPI000CFBAD05|nr:hypothetical protein [Cronobacter malonaticus]